MHVALLEPGDSHCDLSEEKQGQPMPMPWILGWSICDIPAAITGQERAPRLSRSSAYILARVVNAAALVVLCGQRFMRDLSCLWARSFRELPGSGEEMQGTRGTRARMSLVDVQRSLPG